MSSQRGNIQRTRPQKHQNNKVFKNDLHDKTPTQKYINNIHVTNVCLKCKHVLEWKIKYKKYKPLKVPKKCTKCDQKSVKQAYHIMCSTCAHNLNVCAKCGKKEEIVESSSLIEEQIALDNEIQQTIKKLSERKRRTFLRYLAKSQTSKNSTTEQTPQITLDDVRVKLETLKVECDSDDDFCDDSDDSNIDEEDEEASNEDEDTE